MFFFILGGPGSGKGTQCAKIKEEFNFLHFSTGDLLRAEVKKGSEKGAMIEDLMKNGKLVSSEITVQLLKEAIESNKSANGILIDGFPRNLEQAKLFEKEVGEAKFILSLDCPEEEMQKRILKRAEGVPEEERRVDDNLETVKKRFQTHQQEAVPVINYYKTQGKVHEILAVGAVEEIYAKVRVLFISQSKM